LIGDVANQKSSFEYCFNTIVDGFNHIQTLKKDILNRPVHISPWNTRRCRPVDLVFLFGRVEWTLSFRRTLRRKGESGANDVFPTPPCSASFSICFGFGFFAEPTEGGWSCGNVEYADCSETAFF
jgi:hypothetical protein